MKKTKTGPNVDDGWFGFTLDKKAGKYQRVTCEFEFKFHTEVPGPSFFSKILGKQYYNCSYDAKPGKWIKVKIIHPFNQDGEVRLVDFFHTYEVFDIDFRFKGPVLKLGPISDKKTVTNLPETPTTRTLRL